MRIRLRIPVLFTLFLLPGICFAQNVTNVNAALEDNTIAVTYDLNELSTVSLFYSQDGGQSEISIPKQFLSGAIGRNVMPGNGKKIVWYVLEQFPKQGFRGENISFVVKGTPQYRFFTLANIGYSLDAGLNTGLTIGYAKKWGGYAKFITSTTMPFPTTHSCLKDGRIGGTLPAYSGVFKNSKQYGIAGMLYRISPFLYMNAGLGYGFIKHYWQTTDNQWVYNIDLSHGLFAIDAGVIATFNLFAISAGSTFVGNQFDFHLGFGCAF